MVLFIDGACARRAAGLVGGPAPMAMPESAAPEMVAAFDGRAGGAGRLLG
jgi:hypothetical protein